MQPLSDEEIGHLHAMIEADKRATWAWRSLRRWLAWIGGGIAAFGAVLQAIDQFSRFRGP